MRYIVRLQLNLKLDRVFEIATKDVKDDLSWICHTAGGSSNIPAIQSLLSNYRFQVNGKQTGMKLFFLHPEESIVKGGLIWFCQLLGLNLNDVPLVRTHRS
jgi:hypothetical protein